jgi:hypothetical protein
MEKRNGTKELFGFIFQPGDFCPALVCQGFDFLVGFAQADTCGLVALVMELNCVCFGGSYEVF